MEQPAGEDLRGETSDVRREKEEWKKGQRKREEWLMEDKN
jgi:hypothetical protein